VGIFAKKAVDISAFTDHGDCRLCKFKKKFRATNYTKLPRKNRSPYGRVFSLDNRKTILRE